MKYRLSFFMAFIVIALMAFKPGPVLRIKKSVNLIAGSTANYKYDASGRVVQMESSKGAKSTYTYTGDRIISRFIEPGSHTNTDTFFLNAQNRVEVSSGRGNIQKFKYDSKGRFIEALQYIQGKYVGKTSWVWQGDNLKTSIYQDGSGKVRSRIVYTYYTDKINTISQANLGMEFWGQDSKNLISKSESVGNLITEADSTAPAYKYQFNKDGAVVLKVLYDKQGKLTDSTSYSYY